MAKNVKKSNERVKPGSVTYPYVLGKNYFIRTVTTYQVGRLVGVTDKELILEDASWVADTKRWHDSLKTGELNEVEPFLDPVIVGRGAIVDATLWRHPLPTAQK